MKEKQIVGITECFSYNQDEVYESIKKACEVCTFPDVKGKTVLVKPNILSDSNVKNCITTHPEIVRAVIRLLKNKGTAKVLVGDSPGLQTAGFVPKNCGIAKVCNEENVEFVDFTSNAKIHSIEGTTNKVPITDYAFNSDLIFSLSKFKTHQLMYTTGGVKNLFGLIPGLNKSKCHLHNPNRDSFAKFIVGLHETVKPAFCIMDGVIGMEGAGPANGKPRPVNLILCSSSCFATDWAQAIIMGYDPEDIPILKEGIKKGLVSKWIEYPLINPEDKIIEDFDKIAITPNSKFIKDLVFPFLTRSIQRKKQITETAPQFNQDKCIKCKRCINICPAKALNLFENEISIDKNKCIRCYCCHEMCPVEAITIPKLKENK